MESSENEQGYRKKVSVNGHSHKNHDLIQLK